MSLIQINNHCLYNETEHCLESYNTSSLLEAFNSLFDLNIDSNKSIMNVMYLRVVLNSGEEYFAKGFTEILTLFKEQFKIPILIEESYNKTSDNWIIKFDKQYEEAYDDYIKSTMIENKPIITKPKRTRRKKSND
jgi:hypothetical protein